MHESSLNYLHCVRCDSKLFLEIFKKNKEVEEGILECKKCGLLFPIIGKIPIIWNDFSNYLSNRIILGGKLYRIVSHEKMKKFLKNILTDALKQNEDRTTLEERWSQIYQNSKNSKFYSFVKNEIQKLPRAKVVLEHGCSVGITSRFLADHNDIVFGIDRSYAAISVAKKNYKDNLDYFVADSLSPIFGDMKFNGVFALNILELIEPSDFVDHISNQIKKGFFVISDPYDYDRGNKSVKQPLDEITLRKTLKNLGFSILSKTKQPSYHLWDLKISSRCVLNYKVDFIIAKK